MASKLDLAAIVAAACGMLSIEHGNRIFTDVPVRTERSALAAAADCSDNDNMPYTANCLIFLEGKVAFEVPRPRAAERGALAQSAAVKQDEWISTGVDCPANDTVPYSASCIAFLTGRLWQPNTSESAASVVRPSRQEIIGDER